MNVVALNSGRLNGNTNKVLLEIKEILGEHNINLEILNLNKYNIKFCHGCEVCLNKGSCFIDDDVFKIVEKLEKADGIIFASPVYLKMVSGIFKAFADRTCSLYHRPLLFSKPAMVVSTTKGSGLKATLNYLEDFANQMGMICYSKIGRSIINIDKKVSDKEVAKFIKYLNMPKEKHNPSLRLVIDFNIQKVLAYTLGGIDYAYFEEKGFFKRVYYYDCRINIFKRMIGNFIFKFLSKIMLRAKEKNGE